VFAKDQTTYAGKQQVWSFFSDENGKVGKNSGEQKNRGYSQ